MTLIRKLIVGVAATMLTATAAMAADPIIIPPPAPPPPMAMAPVVSPFAGLYFGGHYTQTIVPPGPFRAIGAQAGFNIVNGALLFGGEARVGFVLAPVSSLYLQGNGRVGFVLGDTFLIYGTAGIGTVPGAGPFNYFNFGGGAEFMLGNIGIFAELTRVRSIGLGPAPFNKFAIGLNFHP